MLVVLWHFALFVLLAMGVGIAVGWLLFGGVRADVNTLRRELERVEPRMRSLRREVVSTRRRLAESSEALERQATELARMRALNIELRRRFRALETGAPGRATAPAAGAQSTHDRGPSTSDPQGRTSAR